MMLQISIKWLELVYQAASNEDWDEAEIEKILEKEVEKMLKDGRINKKEYTNIKKIVKRETDKKIYFSCQLYSNITSN